MSRTVVAVARLNKSWGGVVIAHRDVRCVVKGRSVELIEDKTGVSEPFTWDHDAPTLKEMIEHIDWWLDQDKKEDADA